MRNPDLSVDGVFLSTIKHLRQYQHFCKP